MDVPIDGGGKRDVAARRVRRIKALRRKLKSLKRSLRRSPIVLRRSKVRFTGYANNPSEGCTLKDTAYYSPNNPLRIQPQYSAAACCGQTRMGNDGRRWTSVESGNKCKWMHS